MMLIEFFYFGGIVLLLLVEKNLRIERVINFFKVI